jgi:hypothetical protein
MIGLSAGIIAATTVWVVGTLPPKAQHPAVPVVPPTFVVGGYHIHSNRSDGSGSVDAIAEAAARAGLNFIILTDHGDATRLPDTPAYRHGVLVIDAVEINSAAGHIVALNLQDAAPYPLAGEGRDVIEDIHRLGGWAIAAHPDSPRPDLRWRGGGTPLDGIEILNVDTEWRGYSGLALASAAARAWFRGPETVGSLFHSSGTSLERWDAALRAHDTVALAALDAHARMGEDLDSGRVSGRLALSLPTYETMFQTVTETVRLERAPTHDAASDARALLDAIRRGQMFSVVRAYVDAPGALAFTAKTASEQVDLSGAIPETAGVTIRASVPAAIGARVVLLKNGRDAASGDGSAELADAGPGVYRAEARLTGRGVPWIVSNAIRVGALPMLVPSPAPPPLKAQTVATPVPLESWVIEKQPASQASVTMADGALHWRYQLAGGQPAGQYVALATSASGDAAVAQIVFTASAAQPMRLSVQIRLPGGANGQRWRRSVYVDQTARTYRIPLSDLEPVDRRSPLRPVTARVQSVLLVIDTVNARPGTSGEVTLKETGYIRGQ